MREPEKRTEPVGPKKNAEKAKACDILMGTIFGTSALCRPSDATNQLDHVRNRISEQLANSRAVALVQETSDGCQ